jgi:hypothetical protein
MPVVRQLFLRCEPTLASLVVLQEEARSALDLHQAVKPPDLPVRVLQPSTLVTCYPCVFSPSSHLPSFPAVLLATLQAVCTEVLVFAFNLVFNRSSRLPDFLLATLVPSVRPAFQPFYLLPCPSSLPAS